MAARLDPQFGGRSLGFAYVDAKEYGRAAASFEHEAITNDEWTGVPFSNEPYVASLLLARDYQRAIPAAQRILDLEKNEPESMRLNARRLLGIAYEGAGNVEMAKSAFAENSTCQITKFVRGNLSFSCYAR